MKQEFEKYIALAQSLTLVRDNLRAQAFNAVTDVLKKMPNKEILLNIEDDAQQIWTDNNTRIERVYLCGNEENERILVDTEEFLGAEVYCADIIDILEIISRVAYSME